MGLLRYGGDWELKYLLQLLGCFETLLVMVFPDAEMSG